MKLLAIDSSAGPASAALLEDRRLVGESYVHLSQTHSQTLLPMVEQLLATVGWNVGALDALAVSAGPGSFTGVRIGVACVKGLAFPYDTPCCGVSTLEAIAWGGAAEEGSLLCAVMDARLKQVYNALFEVREGVPVRLCEDRALSIADLEAEIAPYGRRVLLLGDGAELCAREFGAWGARLAPESQRWQRASGVAMAALELLARGKAVAPGALMPSYLRLSQAERELRKKQEGST